MAPPVPPPMIYTVFIGFYNFAWGGGGGVRVGRDMVFGGREKIPGAFSHISFPTAP